MKNLKEFKKQDVKNSGITLIALIITIVVMLILVAVTVNIVINSGLLDTTKRAGDDYKTAMDTESHLGEEAQFTVGGVTYNSIEEYRATLGLSSGQGPEEIDFEAIMAEVLANRGDYGEEVGIGTDGSIVDMSLWAYGIYDDTNKYIYLSNQAGSDRIPAYTGDFSNGEIIGTVPQYIMPEGKDEFYTVKYMEYAFYNCSSLTTAPVIPDSVTSMYCTFYGCSSLTTAPEIPASVTDMYRTFSGCSALTGDLVINASLPSVAACDFCLEDAATNDGCDLKLSGTSNKLNEILATKSENSHISLK